MVSSDEYAEFAMRRTRNKGKRRRRRGCVSWSMGTETASVVI